MLDKYFEYKKHKTNFKTSNSWRHNLSDDDLYNVLKSFYFIG